MSFPNVIFGTEGAQFVTNTVAVGQGVNDLGTQLILEDGRKYRWGQQNATTAAVAGDLQQAAVATTGHVLQTPTAAAVGDGSIVTATTTTAIVADEYKGGVLAVELGTGFGYTYSIKTHPAVAANGSFTVPIRETVQVAIPATANTVSLIRNRHKLVVVYPTAPTGTPVGVAIKPVVVSGFGWYATRGLATCTTQGTVIVGNVAIPSGTTAGSVSPQAAATYVQPFVGTVAHVATTTNKSLIDLQLD